MTPEEIARLRLANQQIALHPGKTPGDVVAALGAVQAQDYRSALWAIGLRLPAATEADVERAVADRTIVRTWPMRGTLHFVRATDVRWMLGLLASRAVARSAYRRRQLGLEDTDIVRGRHVLVEALQGGRQRTRPEMMDALQCAGIETVEQRGNHIVRALAQEGLICLATHRGAQPTFALLSEWVPDARALDRDEALCELARRYFAGHGPATLQDLLWWSGLTTAEALSAVELAGHDLARYTVGDTVYWMPPALPDLPPVATAVHLLPAFDEYLLGYRDRSAVLDADAGRRVVPGGNGMFLPIIVVNGRVAGTWKASRSKHAVAVARDLFSSLAATESRALDTAVEEYARFVRMPVERTPSISPGGSALGGG